MKKLQRVRQNCRGFIRLVLCWFLEGSWQIFGRISARPWRKLFTLRAPRRGQARGQRPETRGQPETKIQMRSNRVWVFWFVSLRLDFFRRCVGFLLSWFQVVSWMDATSHFHARPFLNKGETDFMLPAVCSVSPFNLYAAKGPLLRSSS